MSASQFNIEPKLFPSGESNFPLYTSVSTAQPDVILPKHTPRQLSFEQVHFLACSADPMSCQSVVLRMEGARGYPHACRKALELPKLVLRFGNLRRQGCHPSIPSSCSVESHMLQSHSPDSLVLKLPSLQPSFLHPNPKSEIRSFCISSVTLS